MSLIIAAILLLAVPVGRKGFRRYSQRHVHQFIPVGLQYRIQKAKGTSSPNMCDCGHSRSFHSDGKYTCWKGVCGCAHFVAKFNGWIEAEETTLIFRCPCGQDKAETRSGRWTVEQLLTAEQLFQYYDNQQRALLYRPDEAP